MSDPLFVHHLLPNEQTPPLGKAHLQASYGPQAQKTFTGALEAFFFNEFPQLAGDRVRRTVVQAIVDLVHKYYPETTHLRNGQTTWVTVAKDECASYGKNISKTRLVPITLDLIEKNEVANRRDGVPLRTIKREAVARLCLQADAQQGCLTAAELAILLKTTPCTIGKYIAHWEKEHGKLLPRRGTIHDMGPTLTHKKEICRLLFLEGKTVSETIRLTKHSDKAIHRYITNFRQVFTCKTQGLSVPQTAIASGLSRRLVEEYHRLFDVFAVTNAKFDTLLKETPVS